MLLIREKEINPWLGHTLLHRLLSVEMKLSLYSSVRFPPPQQSSCFSASSHAASPQLLLSLINPLSSMALISRSVHILHMARQMLKTPSYVLSPPLLFPFSSVSLTSFSINIFFFHFQHFFSVIWLLYW